MVYFDNFGDELYEFGRDNFSLVCGVVDYECLWENKSGCSCRVLEFSLCLVFYFLGFWFLIRDMFCGEVCMNYVVGFVMIMFISRWILVRIGLWLIVCILRDWIRWRIGEKEMRSFCGVYGIDGFWDRIDS